MSETGIKFSKKNAVKILRENFNARKPKTAPKPLVDLFRKK